MTPQALLGYFGGGVANLPELAVMSVVLGLIAPAITGIRRAADASVVRLERPQEQPRGEVRSWQA
jgi:hypothetical protein